MNKKLTNFRESNRHPSQNDLPPIDKFHPDWWYYRQEMDEPDDEIDNIYKNESKNMNKKLIRVTEQDLHNLVKESAKRIMKEVALKGKSGKTHSLHGTDPESWAVMSRVRGKNGYFPNTPQYYHACRDEDNWIELDDKAHPNLRSRNNANRINAMMNRIDDKSKDIMAANESKLSRIVKESVNRILRENIHNDLQQEVNQIVTSMGSNIEEWLNDTCFVDQHGCVGHIFRNEEDATNSVLYGDDHQNAIDSVDGAQSDEEWVDYLIKGGVEPHLAESMIANQQWDKVIEIIVSKSGPEWFLSGYSGEVHNLSDGSLLYY